MENTIIKKVGDKLGKTIAIFAGIHGNEKVGIEALNILIQDISIKSGTVYFVYANPLAIEKGVRMVNKNMNRLFFSENDDKAEEDIRARELMKILDECEALLDIHSYNSETGDQFAITEPEGFEIVKKMDFPIVASGFSGMGSGTDSYMHTSSKVGICVECGTTNRFEQFIPLAIKSAKQFMQYFGCIDASVEYDSIAQKHITASRIIYKKNEPFRFVKNFLDFEPLPVGQPFAFQGNEPEIAGENECILFPRPNEPVGGEVCIIARTN